MAAMDSYWITWFPAALLAALGVLAMAWKGIVAFTRIQGAAAAITRIEYEFSPNSGTSLRDQVDAVRLEQADVKADLRIQMRQMQDHIAADGRSFDYQARFNQHVEATLDRIEAHVRGPGHRESP